jgi:hypothetical protein
MLQAELQHIAETLPEKGISIIQGHTELLHVWRPATFETLPVHTSRLRQRAEAAKCGRGCNTFSPSPGPSGGEASEGADELERILQAELHHIAKTFPAKSMSIVQSHTELLHV